MSKENLEAACIFGNEAGKVLENKAYQFATTAIKGQIFDKLTNVDILDGNEQVLELVRSLQSVHMIQEQLEQIMQEGTFAEDNLIDRLSNPARYNRC